MNKPGSPQTQHEGLALVIALVVLVLLSTITVAFISSSQLEMLTSRAYANRARAEEAARAGIDVAIAALRNAIASYPDSVTTWETLGQEDGNTGSGSTPATVLYLRAEKDANDPNLPSPPDPAVPLKNTPSGRQTQDVFLLPLVSGGRMVSLPNKSAAIPNLTLSERDVRKQNFVDINFKETPSDTQGWIGTPPPVNGAAPNRQIIKVPWVQMTDTKGAVSRYAYWIEDESFRANVNVLGANIHGRSNDTPGSALSEVPLQAFLKAYLAPDKVDPAANDILLRRNLFLNKHFLEARALNEASGSENIGDKAKFLFTLRSTCNDLSRHGSRRLNINELIASGNTAADITRQINQIVAAIKYHCPDFGQRFYRTTPSDANSRTQVSNADSDLYLRKLAANIRDYIDSDAQPTVLISAGANWTLSPATAPARALGYSSRSSNNEVQAVGKERGPFIHEYALRVKVNTIPTKANKRTYDITLEYYVELWNITNRQIAVSELGRSPFLKIANQPGWDAGGADDIAEGASRDVMIRLDSSWVFPPNSATVITTDAQYAAVAGLMMNGARVLVASPGDVLTADGKNRNYTGRTNLTIAGLPTLLIHTRQSPYAGGTFSLGGVDSKTEVFLGNSNGYIDSQMAAGVIEDNNILVDDFHGHRISGHHKNEQNLFFFRGSAMLGNKADPSGSGAGGTNGSLLLHAGDPRTNNEPLVNNADLVSANASMTRYVTTNARDPIGDRDMGVPAFGTLGAPNWRQTDFSASPANGVAPWQDHPDWKTWLTFPSGAAPQGAVFAPVTVQDGPLSSIGQLGDIFDPVREGTAAQIPYARGGGRSLAIGAKESPRIWDGSFNSNSRNWTAWRLADIFTAAKDKDDPLTTDIDESFELEGRINLNGILRDNGAALRALLSRYQFAADSDAQVANLPALDQNPSAGVEKIIARLAERLDPARTATYKGPLFERGEISELDLFSGGTELTGNVDMAEVNDRAREEIVRRLIELTTTRGSTFSVYVVGQSLVPLESLNSGAAGAGGEQLVVNGTYATKVTFKLVPVFEPLLANGGAGLVAFDGTKSTEVNARFAKPARYEVQILAAEARN